MRKPSWKVKWAWSGAVASLLLGCNESGEAQGARALAPRQPAALESRDQPAPRIVSLEAMGLEETLTATTKSRVQARLARGQEGLFKELPMVSDVGEPVVLRDDGLEGDEEAGDGLFSAITLVDFETHRRTQERISKFQEQSREPLTWVTFDNRVKLGERELQPLSPELFQPGTLIPLLPSGISTAVNPAASLIINDPGVVGDPTRTYDPCTNSGNPNGVWTFNHLMTQMANGFVTPSDLTEHWLDQWNANQGINGWTVPARPDMSTRILNPWPRVGTALDMTQSPFKLVAIVNRLDLGKGSAPGGYGGSSGGGELRFVFAAVDKSANCTVSPFLVIFEYGVPKNRCGEVRTWAQEWLALSDPLLAIGSGSFNAALEALTEQVVVANAAPDKPNGNAINQIRTNEFMIGSPWELREFHLLDTGVSPHFLSEHTVALTPGDSHNNSTLLSDFINANEAGILANSYSVPLKYPTITSHFLGANPQVPFPPSNVFWDAPGINNNDARHKFSLNACSGCHAREADAFFTHIDENGNLSNFLATGMANPNTPFTVTDPVSGVPRDFFEILDRAQHLDSVASQSCLVRAFDLPMLSVH